MPLLPIYVSSSSGVNEFLSLPIENKYSLITFLPNLSGNESANKPGKPLYVSLFKRGNEYGSLLSFMVIGDISIPLLTKESSYVKKMLFSLSFDR